MKPLGISLKFWLVILPALLGIEVALFQFLSLSDKQELRSVSYRVSSLDSKIGVLQTNLYHAQEQLEAANLQNIGFDYSKRQNLPNEPQGSRLLEKISKLVKQLGIKYMAVQSEPEEDYEYYRQRSFSIKASSKFAEVVRFVDQLENSLRLTISNFSVRQNQADPVWHNVGFSLSSIELKPNALSRFKNNAPTEKTTSAQLSTGISRYKQIGKDPFFSPFQGPQPRLTKHRIFVTRRPDLFLNGIMDLMGRKAAIINNEIVREGDSILKYKLIGINKDRVTLSYNKKRYQLNLTGLVTIKSGGLKRPPPRMPASIALSE